MKKGQGIQLHVQKNILVAFGQSQGHTEDLIVGKSSIFVKSGGGLRGQTGTKYFTSRRVDLSNRCMVGVREGSQIQVYILKNWKEAHLVEIGGWNIDDYLPGANEGRILGKCAIP